MKRPSAPPDLKWGDPDGDQGWLSADPEDMDAGQLAVVSVAEAEDGGTWRSVYVSRHTAQTIIAWLTERLDADVSP